MPPPRVGRPYRAPVLRALIVLPAWNEEQALGGVLRELAATLPGTDVLVVDDGSTDGTRGVAQLADVPVLSLPYNLGVGGAMRAGFLYAERHAYDAVVQVDADGQHDPADVPRLLAGLADADIVIGARFAGVGGYLVRGPRWWAMRLLARSLSRRAGVPLTDVTSGFRATSRRAVRLFAATYPAEYLGDTVESLTMATKAGLVVRQVPVAMRPRSHGNPSQSPLKAAVYLSRAILALGLASVRRRPDPLLLTEAAPSSVAERGVAGHPGVAARERTS